MDQKKTGLFLKELRKEKGLTQSQLAEKFGVSDRTVSRWETGSNMPDLSILVELSDYYNIDIKEIIRGERKAVIDPVPEKAVDAAAENITDGERKSGIMKENEKETLLTVADYAETKAKRKSKKHRVINIIVIVILCVFGFTLLKVFTDLGIVALFSSGFNDEYEVTTDTSSYTELIGEGKWEMSEEIFPKNIDNLNVVDFKYVYYDPWDANYLAYLVVDYDSPEEYNAEISRLNKIGIDDYKYYYGITGFTDYDLVAIDIGDSNQGLVYALTDGKSRIIYCELIFCNYYMDIVYTECMPAEYLPEGFDATLDNKYSDIYYQESVDSEPEWMHILS